MSTVDRVKGWLKENAPMLTVLYENKYVGMAYDRFASLPPKEQKQTMIAVFGGFAALVFGYLLLSYLSVWSDSSKAKESQKMVNEIQAYQRTMRDKLGRLQALQSVSSFGGEGQLKAHLTGIARSSAISPRMMEVTEQGEDTLAGAKVRKALVKLQRMTLTQWVGFLRSIETAPQRVSPTSLKAKNDEKLRGYMQVEIGVVAPMLGDSSGAEGSGEGGTAPGEPPSKAGGR